MKQLRFASALVALGCVTPASVRAEVAQAAKNVLDVETAVGLETVRDAAIDPTGELIVYVLSVPRTPDDEPGSPYSEIWVIPSDGGAARRFSPPGSNASSPRWAPDGSTIAFILGGEDDDPAQIHLIPIDGGGAASLTDHETSVGAPRWSPDGRTIAFVAADPETEKEIDDKDSGRDWTVVDDDGSFERLWLIDVETGESRPVYDDALNVGDFEWTPDGRSIVMTAAATPRIDTAMMYSRVYRVAAEGGAPEVLCPTVGKLGRLAPSPDGRTLAFLGATSLNDPLSQSVFVTPIDGSSPRNLSTDAEASAAQIAWADDHRALVQLANDGTRTRLSVVDADTGAARTLAGGGPMVSAIDVRPGLARFVAVADTPEHPSEVYLGSLDSAELTRLTHHNSRLDALDLATSETIDWTSTDGARIQGVITWPPGHDRDRAAPLVVNPHGGPEGVTQQGWSTLAQLLAARGYLVLQPNYRGSGGRGVAFSKGDHDDLGGQEFRDILAGVDALIDQGLVDPDRVGMGGWSYGGYMSAMAATHHSPRFKAAVMGAGISNWVSFTGTTDIPDEMSIVHWNQPMHENFYLYWTRSPLSAIARAETPTLILYGANDARVPPSQGHELHQALEERGVPTEMVLYPRAGHGIRERAHLVDLYTRQLEWFDKYVK